MIKEKRQLFVTVGNNDDTAKMKVNKRRNFFISSLLTVFCQYKREKFVLKTWIKI